jgi:hypothetical protein
MSVVPWEMAAGREGVPEPGHDPGRVLGVGEEVQDRHEQQGDRLAEVDQLPDLGVPQDPVGLAQVGLDHEGAVAGQQGAAVRHHHRVVVHVHDPGVGGDLLGDLVDVAPGRQAAAEVDELADAGLAGQEADGPAQERPVVLDHLAGDGRDAEELVGHLTVGGEVVLAAQEVVVDAGRVRHAGVDGGGPVVGHLVLASAGGRGTCSLAATARRASR